MKIIIVFIEIFNKLSSFSSSKNGKNQMKLAVCTNLTYLLCQKNEMSQLVWVIFFTYFYDFCFICLFSFSVVRRFSCRMLWLMKFQNSFSVRKMRNVIFLKIWFHFIRFMAEKNTSPNNSDRILCTSKWKSKKKSTLLSCICIVAVHMWWCFCSKCKKCAFQQYLIHSIL